MPFRAVYSSSLPQEGYHDKGSMDGQWVPKEFKDGSKVTEEKHSFPRWGHGTRANMGPMARAVCLIHKCERASQKESIPFLTGLRYIRAHREVVRPSAEIFGNFEKVFAL